MRSGLQKLVISFSKELLSVILYTDYDPYTGLNFKLDVGLYRLDQRVACQRIDKPE